MILFKLIQKDLDILNVKKYLDIDFLGYVILQGETNYETKCVLLPSVSDIICA